MNNLLKITAIFLLIQTCSLFNPMQAHSVPPPKHSGFTILWAQADSLANLGQPRSALEIVDKIYSAAKAEKNDPQVIRAVIYRIRLNAGFSENSLEASIRDLQKEISMAAQPAKQVLQSIQAELYRKYYQNNQFRLRDRSRLAENRSDSLETWDLSKIYNTATRTYLHSLENPDTLKKVSIEQYMAILDCEISGDAKKEQELSFAAKFHPTLYDFLASRALDFFTSGESGNVLPAVHFEIDQPWYLLPAKNFIANRMMIPADSMAPASFALRIYRDLATFHFRDSDRAALIDAELKRLDFVHDKAIFAGKDSIYIATLKGFEEAESASPWSTSVSYALADFLNLQGQKYQPLLSDRFKWQVKEALDICSNAVKKFPDSEGAKNCLTLKKQILTPSLRITTENAVPTNKPSLSLVNYRNIKELNFRLIRTDPDIYSEKNSTANQDEMISYLGSLRSIQSWTLITPNDGDHQSHAFETRIPEVKAGFYILFACTSEDFSSKDAVFSYTPFWSTQIAYTSRRAENGSQEFFLADRVTGLPLKKAKAEAWVKNFDFRERKYTEINLNDYTSDNSGFLSVPAVEKGDGNANIYLKIRYGDDFYITNNFYQYPVYSQPERSYLQTMFYTDRAIYRPGQTIYFKGIVLERSGEKTRIKPNHATKVTFTDVNGQKISDQTLTTNEFGSINGSFTAPQGLLPGMMTISSETGSIQVSVESYKIPTFEVTLSPVTGNYKLGEKIGMTGTAKAYSGSAVTGAPVKYRVVRSARFPWFNMYWYRPFPSSPETEITSGTTITDNAGNFKVEFSAIPDLLLEKESNPVFDFNIYADVTSPGGETESMQQTVSAGNTSMIIGINVPEMVNRESDSVFTLKTTNLNGVATPAKVTVTLKRLQPPDRPLKPRSWERPDLLLTSREEFHAIFPYDIYGDETNPATWKVADTICQATLNTATDTLLNLLHLPSHIPHPVSPILYPASYLLTLTSTDPFGQPVEIKRIFTLFSANSTQVPGNRFCWFAPLKTSCDPGEKARFLVGSTEDNVSMMFEVTHHDSLVSRAWLKMGDQARDVEIPVTEKLRGNFAVNFIFIKQNRVFQNSSIVQVPYSDRKLAINFETFRSKLEPGAKETWKIRITGPAGKAAKAELLAAMYDASLDVFRENQWNFDIYQRFSGTSPWDDKNSFPISTGNSRLPDRQLYDFGFHPTLQLNWFGYSSYGGNVRYKMGRSGGQDVIMAMHAVSAPVAGMVSDGRGNAGKAVAETSTAMVADNSDKPKPAAAASPQFRRDFRETAFFYPSLVTDSTGSLLISFTVPESLTRWKMLGMAHTKNLNYGLVEKELVTQKELMVFPNAPRFVRQGDTVVFSAGIANMAGREITGRIILDLADGLSLKSCNTLADTAGNPGSMPREQSFSLKKDETRSISWRFIMLVSSSPALLRYRVTAQAGSFSDGEEKMIPVLTNRMLVTETLPLPVRGKGTFSFSFDKLLQSGKTTGKELTLKKHRLTIEFATNPAWYAIMALPALNDVQYETADAIFSAWWSNSLASFIANSNPKIRPMFDAWKTLSPDALKSNLMKNEELKSALIRETPWVAEAASETEQKQNLGLYFDQNRIDATLKSGLAKLINLQSPDGGWGWMPGMPENRYTTQAIVTGIGKLYHLGVLKTPGDPAIRTMLTKAFGYLDQQLIKDFDDIKKQDPAWQKNNHLGSTQIQYLYALSFFDPSSPIPHPPSRNPDALSYFTSQSETFWLKQDRFLQGMIALALNRSGKKEIPQLIMKSLAENAVHSPESGMYWASEQGFFWHQAPIETQAMMIEAFDEVSNDQGAVEEMKIWLLKQKQTQSWKSSRATLEACYVLLLRGADLLDPQSQEGGGNITVTLGKEKIDSEKLTDVKREPGTGFFQVSWSGSEIRPEMGKITVTKNGTGVAWGACYWQYFENLDKITPASTPLHLEKKLYVERNTATGPELEEVQGSKFKVQSADQELVRGDKLVVRIVITVDRDMEFVHLRDMRASGFEPRVTESSGQFQKFGRETGSNGLSGYRYQDGLGYYQGTTDEAENFFFDYLPKGSYVFEYGLKVNAAGAYSNGITTIQCMYAPEFAAHSEGVRVAVGK